MYIRIFVLPNIALCMSTEIPVLVSLQYLEDTVKLFWQGKNKKKNLYILGFDIFFY